MRRNYTWLLPRTSIALGKRTAIMGILNVTPDSFSDGGAYLEPEKALERGVQLQEQGADIVDIGGESSRPGSRAVSEDEEARRVLPIVEALGRRLTIPISIDTYRSQIARRALDAGAQIVNDISAFRFDPEMATVVRDHKAAVVLMHSRGNREDLHTQPPMDDAVKQVLADLKKSVQLALDCGIARESIVIDPGIGFGKRAEESLALLQNVRGLSPLECAVLVGTSRKSFIRKVAGIGADQPYSANWGTAATVAVAVMQGAHIVRVHDVQEMRTFVDVMDAVVD
jgi:dihydropteroate synthase